MYVRKKEFWLVTQNIQKDIESGVLDEEA